MTVATEWPKKVLTREELELRYERLRRKNWNRRKALKSMEIALMRERALSIRHQRNAKMWRTCVSSLEQTITDLNERHSPGPALGAGIAIGLCVGILVIGVIGFGVL